MSKLPGLAGWILSMLLSTCSGKISYQYITYLANSFMNAQEVILKCTWTVKVSAKCVMIINFMKYLRVLQ